jgi:hypothetical protein
MSTVQNRSQARNSNSQHGGQYSLGLFGVTDRCHAEHAAILTSKAQAPAPGALSQAVARAIYGNARPAFAAASRALRAERECQPKSPAFHDEAEAQYEAHMAEIAEARSHQLDAEADRYACCFAGAGYTEHLMAMEG